jgi:hypothetical protein
MRSMTRRALLLTTLCLGACLTTEPTPVSNCSLAVRANTAGAPVFEWSHFCPVAGLNVTAADNRGDVKWSIATSDQQANLNGPVTYGQVPTGLIEGTPPAVLAALITG